MMYQGFLVILPFFCGAFSVYTPIVRTAGSLAFLSIARSSSSSVCEITESSSRIWRGATATAALRCPASIVLAAAAPAAIVHAGQGASRRATNASTTRP